ncbi:hypothetical protein SF1_43220 [Sphingobacterium faecium NBRC 15299]|uniref:hypothetical protein n=1 Tax=Sphingobacterium faecium TaxID=34087 RepID=UPI000D374AAD|nr:hypothetical protein [Sphingobacterium faecium]PTX06467.1 hypothetical protein C8N37_1158 [Sphingobacterium faecium]GEM66340.1 hypothetical protein SF1_43220 [Sphingobacterium faecium NBRC 15299]
MGTFDFLKRWNSKPSVKKRLRKLLNSLYESLADNQYFQQTVEYNHQEEWELAIESLIELGSSGSAQFTKEVWVELYQLANEIGLDENANYCRKQIDLIASETYEIDEIDELGFSKSELEYYDKHVRFYYTNIVNSLILFTYKYRELELMASPIFDPMTELYEELEYACTPVCFETVFRKNLIPIIYKQELLRFKTKVDQMPSEIWDWEYLEEHPSWINIRTDAEEILKKMGIPHRVYDYSFTNVISSSGEVIKRKKSEDG